MEEASVAHSRKNNSLNWCLLAGWESERTTIGLSHEPSWTRFWTALRVRGTAAGLDVLEEWTQRIEGHTRLFHAASRRTFLARRVQETWRQRKGIAAAKGVAGTLSKHGQDSGRLGYFFGYFGKKIKKLKVDIQRIRQGFAYPLVFYYRINGLLSKNNADFFFFLFFRGRKKYI